MKGRLRKPTFDEIDVRVGNLRFAIGCICYLVLGLGGHLLANRYIYESTYLELFNSVWWIPSGFASFAIALLSTNWITSWVEE